MPRLFTGVEVPYEVGLALSLKRGGLFGARWIDTENYHITLRFIGDVDHHVASDVSGMLDRLVGSEAFKVKLNHLDSFGGDKPRALYAGVENNAALVRLIFPKAQLGRGMAINSVISGGSIISGAVSR